ncbi:hypothetical protein F511_34993 [Dorcoceras hygrometricum]|uniref:Uncharacterized protein n=1 Tax=Dorcoceras hygrometricum TaxID=472368 RepID=A0A2Z7CIX3_9LAMI|nr:hypothetical protein F511_34993 [Dorcoceras hygrometricum]
MSYTHRGHTYSVADPIELLFPFSCIASAFYSCCLLLFIVALRYSAGRGASPTGGAQEVSLGNPVASYSAIVYPVDLVPRRKKRRSSIRCSSAGQPDASNSTIQSRASMNQLLRYASSRKDPDARKADVAKHCNQAQSIQSTKISAEDEFNRSDKSAAKQLTIYESWMSTAELNSNGENDKKPAKEKDTKALYTSRAPLKKKTGRGWCRCEAVAENKLIAQCTSRGKNEKKGEAIDRH